MADDGEPNPELDAKKGSTERRDGVRDPLSDVAEAMSALVKGPGQIFADSLKNLDLSRDHLTDTLRRATELSTRANALLPPRDSVPMIPYRDPDEATRRVAEEVRDLAEISAATAESARINAETAKASLDQTAALVAAVQSLHETTRQGIAAGQVRDAAAAKREVVLSGLTWALVALTAVLAIAAILQLWSDAEPWRAGIANWIQAVEQGR